jgi:hypothetical protein
MAGEATGTTTTATTQVATEKKETPAAAGGGETGKGGSTSETKPAGETTSTEKPAETKPAATTESKTAEGTKVDDKGKPATEEAKPKAPEKYDLKLPEGADVLNLGQDDLTFLEQLARANDWTQAEANEELKSVIDRATAAVNARISRLEAQTKADADYGGDNLAETQRLAKIAIDRIRPVGHPRREAFLSLLKNSGASVHLEAVSYFADLGRMMGEDGTTITKAATSSGVDGESFYSHPSSRKVQEEAKAAHARS